MLTTQASLAQNLKIIPTEERRELPEVRFVSREQLYELVWSMPMTQAAEKFLVSGSYMARVCSVLRVPHPERGYWAKLAVGKAPARPALPDALPGDQLAWSQDGDLPLPRLQTAGTATTSAPTTSTPHRFRNTWTDPRGEQHYERGYKVEDGQLLRPYKRTLVDVTVLAAGLDKALSFANDLFNTLESAGHRVCLELQAHGFIGLISMTTKCRNNPVVTNTPTAIGIFGHLTAPPLRMWTRFRSAWHWAQTLITSFQDSQRIPDTPIGLKSSEQGEGQRAELPGKAVIERILRTQAYAPGE